METGNVQKSGLRDGAVAMINGRPSLYLIKTLNDYVEERSGFGISEWDLKRAMGDGAVSVVIDYQGIQRDCCFSCDLKTYLRSGDSVLLHNGFMRFVSIHEMNVIDGEPGELP